MLEQHDELSGPTNTKFSLSNLVSAAIQYDFAESMAWHAHQLKNEAFFYGEWWSGLTPLVASGSNVHPENSLELCGEKLSSEGFIFSRSGDNFAVRMKWDDAICAWEKSLDCFQPVKEGNFSRLVATIFTKIGIAYYIKDDIYMAYESFQQALNIQEASLDPGDEDISITVKNLWIVRVRMKDSTENLLSRDLLLLHMMNSLLLKLL